MNRYLVFFTFLFCIFLISGSYSYSQAQGISNFHFKNYQVNDGLSQNTVNTILQDKKGFLWVGTKDGLNKFDGNNFTVYRYQEDKVSLGNNSVVSLEEGNNGELYVGTDGGLYVMNMKDEIFESIESKLNITTKKINSVTSMLLDDKGCLWITTGAQGVFLYDPHQKKLDYIKSTGYDLSKIRNWCVFKDRSGCIWIGSRLGLFRYNTGSKQLEPVKELLGDNNNPEKEVMSIFEDEKGNLWLGTWSDGIILYNRQQNKIMTYCNERSDSYYITHIRSFLQYDLSNLLIGADDGLYLFNIESKHCKRIDVPYYRYSIGDQNVYSMLRDREGGIWIGTYFGGLNYLNTSIWNMERYLPNNQEGFLSGKAISQFCEDESGNLWIATEDGGLNYFNTKTKKITQPVQTSYHNIHPLLIVGDELWIGTFSRGLDIYNLKTKQIRNYRHNPKNPNSIDDDCIFSLLKTRNGDIYVGTTMGLNKYNKQTNDFTHIEAGSITFVYDIKEDSYQNLWIASYNTGAIKWDAAKNKWFHYNDILYDNVPDKKDPIVNSRLISIYIDNQKRLWFSSEGRGIFLYDYKKDNFKNISEKDGLPNNVVYGILDDQFGNLWLSSNQGLVSFSPSDVRKQKRYTQEDGLQSLEFNFKSSYKSSDGKLYFGGINGFNCFYPQDIHSNANEIIPPVEITDIQLLGETTDEMDRYLSKCLNKKEPLKLSYKNSSFTISYISLSYVAQEKNQYAYKLEEVDKDWNHVGNNKSVTYVNLAPGKYTFRVIASGKNGVWNEKGSELKIEILPPVWQSMPARIGYLILLISSVYLAFAYYSKRNRKKQQQQLENFKSEQETLTLKSKIEFFTNIAHEIRTPVSLIQAPLEEIMHSGDGNNSTKQNLSIIDKNSERLIVLTNQLLDFRRMDSTKYVIHPGKINLKEFIVELQERFQKTALKKGISIDLILPEQPDLWVISDADALTKIISNFLTNAMKYTCDNITIDLQVIGEQGYAVSVKDNGVGIPNDFKGLIFDPFYQIKKTAKEKGAGVGLFLAKQLSNMLGGDIEVLDNQPAGSIFKFSFSSLKEDVLETMIQPDLAGEQKENLLSDDMSEKRSILIVDDNVEMLQFIENSLSVQHRVDTAESVAEALEKLEKKLYDLIISDIMMPDIHGLEFTRMLRENVNFSHIPIIVLSAKTDNSTKIESLELGADVFIEKPFSISFLKAQISSLLANRKAIIDTFNRSPLVSYSILSTNKSDQEFLTRLNVEIDKHISDSSFSIELLADQLFISRSNLQRKLKSICGFTPGDYLRTYRLKKAAILLLENKRLINEVAYDVGFSSSSYFTKCFTKQYGMLPKDFVRQHTDSSEIEV